MEFGLFVFGLLASTQPVDFAKRSTDLFTREVVPHFDRDLAHRTTRQREAALAKSNGA